MKHGQKLEKKSGKVSKASPSAKGSRQTARKEKSSAEAKGSRGTKAAKTGGPTNGRAKASQGGAAREASKGTSPAFSNPVVAAAYKRAVKKYSTALRKLSD